MKITGRHLRALIRETIMSEKLEVIAGTLTVKIMPATGATAELDGKPIETEEKVFVTEGPHTVTLKQGGKTATFEFTPTPNGLYGTQRGSSLVVMASTLMRQTMAPLAARTASRPLAMRTV